MCYVMSLVDREYMCSKIDGYIFKVIYYACVFTKFSISKTKSMYFCVEESTLGWVYLLACVY